MVVEKIAERVSARLAELGVGEGIDPVGDIERELAFVVAFCGLPTVDAELDDELCAICEDLALAAIIERCALLTKSSAVRSVSMGDVSVGYGQSEQAAQGQFAESIYRKAIARLAARRGVKW